MTHAVRAGGRRCRGLRGHCAGGSHRRNLQRHDRDSAAACCCRRCWRRSSAWSIVVPVLSFAMLITNAHRLWLYRKHANLKLIGSVLITVVPCVVIGTTIYLGLSPERSRRARLLPPAVDFRSAGSWRGASFSSVRSASRWRAAASASSRNDAGAGMLMVPVLLGAAWPVRHSSPPMPRSRSRSISPRP